MKLTPVTFAVIGVYLFPPSTHRVRYHQSTQPGTLRKTDTDYGTLNRA